METEKKTREQELREELASIEASKKEAMAAAKANYETNRDAVTIDLCSKAMDISGILRAFKGDCESMFNEIQEELNQYGGLRGNSKGGFQLLHSNGEIKCKRTRSTKPTWDERSTKAMELLHDFLHDTVKKIDLSLFEILLSFIEKNAEGQLEYARVMNLLQHRDKYQDERWVKGLDLIQESYSNALRGYGYEFYCKNASGAWDKIEINFTAVDSENEIEEIIEIED